MAGEKVVFASFFHGPEDTMDSMTSWEYLSVAFGMRPLSPPIGTD
ncbi:MAG: hypothetical protein QOD62_527 [Actinomycetota bacterium]|nr:hypothetical protein [Actinomycetota bacterium]